MTLQFLYPNVSGNICAISYQRFPWKKASRVSIRSHAAMQEIEGGQLSFFERKEEPDLFYVPSCGVLG